jgi:hypothetical protein
MRALILAVALLVSSSSFAQAPPADGQKRIGVVVEPHIGTTLFTFTANNTNGALGTLQGGFLVGAKIDRVIVGLGFDLARVATGANNGTGGPTVTTATTDILFTPGVRVAIVRSADHRVELFGQFDLGFGTTVTDQNNNTSYFHLAYDVGPGIRFWAHRQFAVGAVTGVRGEFEFDSTHVAGSNITTSTSSGLTSIFAALQLTGVF